MISGFKFRKASKDDLAAIVALLADDALGQGREHVNTSGVDQAYLDAFVAIDQDPSQFLVVMLQDEKVVGCAQISFIPGLSRAGSWRGQIESVRIAKEMRGIGLGQVLVDWCVEKCRRNRCHLIQLTSDKSRPQAIKFYQSLGFVASHEGMKLQL